MSFDLEIFRKAKFSTREEVIHLPELEAAGFGDGKITVRGLSAEDIARANEASDRSKALVGLVDKLAGSQKEKVDALLEGIGYGKDVPSSLAKRIQHVMYGVVEPKMEQQDVVRFADAYPIEFAQVANKTLELTGQGKVAEVKRKPSGKKPASKPA